MKAWRLCRLPYATLSGEGGRLVAGRWHSQGQPIIYMATEAALAVLEARVNLGLHFEDLPRDYVLLSIETGDATTEHVTSFPENPRAFGDAWLRSQRTALLCVPSVIVPQARNLLLNPLHPQAAQARIIGTTNFSFDARLWNV